MHSIYGIFEGKNIGYENIKRIKNKPNCTAGGFHWIDYEEQEVA